MPDMGIPPRLQGAQLVIGGQQGLDSMVRVADSATRQLDVDLFAGSSPAFERIAVERPGVDQLYLADPELKKSVRERVDAAGARLVSVGEEPAKNHAKSVVADAERAAVTTAAFAPKTPQRYEVGVEFGGDAARAMSELTRARAGGDTAAIQAAADAARGHGIVVNDPAHGVWHLTEEVRGMVAGAQERLIIATKRLEEPGIMRDIESAKARGVAVEVSRKVGRGDMPLHANVVIADDAAYIGSGHLTKRVLTGGGTNGRISRELGVMVEDAALVDELARSLEQHGFIGRLDEAGIPQPRGMSTARRLGIAGGALAAVAGGVALVATRGGDS